LGIVDDLRFARHLFLHETLYARISLVFDSVDSPYCARNLRQISLGPTFSLARNFITTRCATVIGTALLFILIPTNCGEGRVRLQVEEGLHNPTTTSLKVTTQSCS
jgi:hypothetical protein